MATGMPNGTGSTADSPERIKAEIAATRQQLGDTVELLVARADVKRRARSEVSALTRRAKSNPVPLAMAAGLVFAALSLAVWQRTRQHGKGS
jgi:hypothetical protein